MAIDKALMQAPQGLGSLSDPEIEVHIIDPEAVSIEGPGFEMHIGHAESQFDANLAEELPESLLMSLAYELLGDIDEDIQSRKDWLDTYVKGLQLLGLKYEERTEPWPGACGVYHPLLMEAAVKFQSETIMETFPSAGPVRTQIIGKETPDKKEAATRVQEDMNYELTEVMKEYRPEHERLLLSVALSGNAFKKIYFDPSINRQVAMFISAEDVIVPYGAVNIEQAERITHRMRKTKNELRKLQVAGFYRDVDLGDPVRIMDEVEKRKAEQQGFSASMDDRYQILEIHCNMDLPGYEDRNKHGEETGIKLPYVVTIEKGTSTVLSIRRNWLEEDSLKLRRQHFVHYGYIPGFGFYYFGLIHLIGGHTKAATSLIRQLIDAGTLSNLPGGLKAKGLRVKGDETPIAPGEFRDVDLPSGSIRDNILPLPYKEPSQVLTALMDKIVEDGRRFAGAGDLNVSDMSAQAPVGTTLAILERNLKMMGAIQARIHYTMKQEFKLLAAIIRDNTPESYDYEPEVGSASAKRSDYDHVDVLPVSDPNASTMAQRVVQYQAVLQLAQTAPQIYNLPFLHRQMIETIGVKNAQKIVPMQDDMQPVDPVSENMFILTGKPVKAFMYQDHDAHIQTHMAAMQDPMMQKIIGQNPQAQQIMGAGAAHLMEHVAFKYRNEIQKQLGTQLPPPPDLENDMGYLPPEIEVQISSLAAQAAQQLLQNNQQQAAQQQAQQQAQDPLIQMQQQELHLKQQEVQIKAQQAQQQAQIAQQELQLKQMQVQLDAEIKRAEQGRKAKKDVMDASARADDIKLRGQELQVTHELHGAKLGVDIVHKKRLHAAQVAQQVDKQGLDESKHQLDAAKVGIDMAHKKALHKADVAKTLDEHELQRKQIEKMAKGGEVKSEKDDDDNDDEDDGDDND
jgi:hypothetical protein